MEYIFSLPEVQRAVRHMAITHINQASRGKVIMLAVLLANTVFYKEKKRLLTINDADGRRFIICYIHHQDGQKH